MRKLIPWIVLALIIRLAVMATTAHEDLFSTYLRSALLLEGIVTFGLLSAVPHIIQAAWLFIIRPVMPTYDAFFDQPVTTLEGNPEVYGAMMTDPYVMWYVFLMKIPYFLFEIGIFILISYLLIPKKRMFILLWLFNIPLIYSVYIFGRYETITIFMLLAAVVALQKNYTYAFLALCGLLCITRAFFIILIPFILIYLYKRKLWNTQLWMAILGGGAILTFILKDTFIGIATGKFSLFFMYFIYDAFFIPLYPLVYGVLLVGALKIQRISKQQLLTLCSIVIGAFFIIAYWNHQYFTWITPALILLATKNLQGLYAWITTMTGFILYTLLFREFSTIYLISPFNYELAQTLAEQLFPQYHYHFIAIALIGRVIIAGAILYLAYINKDYIYSIFANKQKSLP